MRILSAKSQSGNGKQDLQRKRRKRSAGARKSLSPRLEGLEDRTLLTAISVLNTDDSGLGSLRQAIIDANAQPGADEIQFADGVQGTIALTSGQLAITDELTIDGPGAEVLTVSGSGLSRVFHVAGAKVTMGDITIAGGVATDFVPANPDLVPFAGGGGLLNLSGDVTLNHVHVTGNSTQNAVGVGGGVANAFGAHLTVNSSTFSDNQAFGLLIGVGGAISADANSVLTVNDTTFSGNKAIAGTGFNPDVQFSGLGDGGAVWGAFGSTANITNSRFENNLAKGGDGVAGTGQGAGFSLGGAIGFNDTSLLGVAPATINVSDSTFSGNQSIGGKGADGPEGVRGGNGGPGYAGAIHLGAFTSGGLQATVTGSEFTENQAIAGDGGNGGAGADGGESGNYNDVYVGTFHGAMTSSGGTLTVNESSFSDNLVQGGKGGNGGSGGSGGDSARVLAGGISIEAGSGVVPGTLTLTNSTVTNNRVIAGQGGKAGEGGDHDGRDSDAFAGGVWSVSPLEIAGLVHLNITDSTVSGNVVQGSSNANTDGAGILADIGTTLKLTTVTISDNKQVVEDVETVIDSYRCAGTVTADGCVAEGSSILVFNRNDSGLGSLRQAILIANAEPGADEIQFEEGLQGTISLTSGQLHITGELTIDGPGADVLKVSGSGMSRVFLVTGTTLTIDDITIADGIATDYAIDSPEFAPYAAGGGLRNIGSNVTLNNVHVVGNTAQNFVAAGGGISSGDSESSTTINGGFFSDNQAIGLGIGVGGAIDFSEGSLTVIDTVFSGNKAIALTGLNPDVEFSGVGDGGAIFGSANAHASITNSQFENNVAKGGDGIEGTGQDAGLSVGGAIGFAYFNNFSAGPSTLNVVGSTFSGNQSVGGKGADGPDGVRGGNGGPGFSGAIHIYGGAEATVTGSQFVGNHAITGDGGNGGAGADGGESGNYGNIYFGGGAGAMTIDGGTLTVIDSSFADNVVQGGNGGQGGSGGNGGHGSSTNGGTIVVNTWDEGFTVPVALNMTNATVTNNTVIAGRGGAAGEGGARNGDDGKALGGGVYAFSTTGKAGLIFVNVTDSTITGNSVQASSDGGANGAGLLAGIGANVTLTNVDISTNKKVVNDVESVVDGFACEGIPTADGCVAAQQGDANRDGKVDMDDFLALAAAFGEEGDWLDGDFDQDGTVGFSDFLFLAKNFGQSNPWL